MNETHIFWYNVGERINVMLRISLAKRALVKEVVKVKWIFNGDKTFKCEPEWVVTVEVFVMNCGKWKFCDRETFSLQLRSCFVYVIAVVLFWWSFFIEYFIGCWEKGWKQGWTLENKLTYFKSFAKCNTWQFCTESASCLVLLPFPHKTTLP